MKQVKKSPTKLIISGTGMEDTTINGCAYIVMGAYTNSLFVTFDDDVAKAIVKNKAAGKTK